MASDTGTGTGHSGTGHSGTGNRETGNRETGAAMGCTEFRAQLLAIVDGELRDDRAPAARRHEELCADCASRVVAERAFEVRIGAALLTAADPVDTARLLDTARSRAARPSAGRVVRPTRWLRAIAASAALLFIAVQGAWFFCIPPFECELLQAVELVARSGDGTPLEAAPRPDGALGRLAPPSTLAGFARSEVPQLSALRLAHALRAVRARYGCEHLGFTAVWCDVGAHHPSFRREVEYGGRTWWVAEEGGHRIVAWMCPRTGTLCSLVGDLPEDAFLEVAARVRDHAD